MDVQRRLEQLALSSLTETECPDADRLAAYILGTLTETDQLIVAAHARTCPLCQHDIAAGRPLHPFGGRRAGAGPDPCAGPEPGRELSTCLNSQCPNASWPRRSTRNCSTRASRRSSAPRRCCPTRRCILPFIRR